jgi:hypothetical protein
MATEKKKVTKAQVQKQLNAAGKALNHPHLTSNTSRKAPKTAKARALVELAAKVAVFQTFCHDENKSFGTPTTDFFKADGITQQHIHDTGHNAETLGSGQS